ncbi:MAG: family 16 glycoside hydrolase [Fimbriimonadaceae bacterium]
MNPALVALAMFQTNAFEPGLALRSYWVDPALQRVPVFADWLTPNYVSTIGNVNLRAASEIGNLGGGSFCALSGFINISKPGAYVLRLSANGGSRLMLDEHVVIADHGKPSYGAKEALLNLGQGRHKLLIEYLHLTSAPTLRLAWIQPGSSRFELVPASAFEHIVSAETKTEMGKKEPLVSPERDRPGDGLPVIGWPQGFSGSGPSSSEKAPGFTVKAPAHKFDTARLIRAGSPVALLPTMDGGSQVFRLKSGSFKGQLVYNALPNRIDRALVETISGTSQACIFRFAGGRVDSSRVASTGVAGFDIKSVGAFANGLEIVLTSPLAKGIGRDPADYQLRQWRYASADYGCAPAETQLLKVTSATVSGDGLRVFLECREMKAGRVVYLRLGHGFHDLHDRPIWTTEAWYTMNKVPTRKHKVAAAPEPLNTLSASEKAAGFKSLFNGKDLTGFKGFNSPTVAPAWKVINGIIAVQPELDGGDLTTIRQYGDFELRLEWKASPGANSGIMYRASESQKYAYLTGPEMQVLDDERHGDGQSKLTSAGSMYALVGRTWDMARPAGSWNEVRIICRGNHVEHWLNGAKVVSIEIGSAKWNELVKASKFQRRADFGTFKKGHIVLQDHGDRVWYRSIRIKPL